MYAYKQKLKPYIDKALESGDISEKTILALGAACSIMSYTEDDCDIKDNLVGAQKYLKRYERTSDDDYLQICLDRLSHARKFLIEMKQKLHFLDADELDKYESFMRWHDQLCAQCNKKKP